MPKVRTDADVLAEITKCSTDRAAALAAAEDHYECLVNLWDEGQSSHGLTFKAMGEACVPPYTEQAVTVAVRRARTGKR